MSDRVFSFTKKQGRRLNSVTAPDEDDQVQVIGDELRGSYQQTTKGCWGRGSLALIGSKLVTILECPLVDGDHRRNELKRGLN